MQLHFELEKISNIFRDIYRITGHQCAIFDPNFNALLRYPAQPNGFCQLIQSSPVGKVKCEGCDRFGFARAKETGRLCVYACHAGLTEVCVPIKSAGANGEILGYVMLGHLLDADSSLETQWEKVYDSCHAYMDALPALQEEFFKLIPTSRDGIKALCHILQICIEHLLLQRLILHSGDDLWQRIQTYIQNNLHERMPLTEIANALSVSVSTLNRSAEKNVHTSIGKFILTERIALACRLLRETQYSISQVAARCGIGDYNYFSRVFKAQTGFTPRAYRKTVLSNK